MKDINKANFTAFKRYVFNCFKKQCKIDSYKKKVEKFSVVETYTSGTLNPSGKKRKKENLNITLINPSNQKFRVSLDNNYLKEWLCDLSYAQVDVTNLKESWNKIILDTFFERIEGVINSNDF